MGEVWDHYGSMGMGVPLLRIPGISLEDFWQASARPAAQNTSASSLALQDLTDQIAGTSPLKKKPVQ